MERFSKIFKAEIKEVDKDKSTVIAKISDQTLDRHGDIILISAWGKGLGDFKKHPVLLSSHSYRSLQSQIGRVDKVWVDEKEKALMAKMTYFTNSGNAEADWGFKLAEMKQAAYSVGFISKKSVTAWNTNEDEIKEILAQNGIKLKKDQKVNRIFTEVNLLENSHVTVPANPSALQKSLNEEENPILVEIMNELKDINEDLSVYDKCDECNKEDNEDKSNDNLSDWESKLPHHVFDGDEITTEFKDVASAMVTLLSDVDLSDDLKESAYDHLKKHYDEFDAKAPEFRTYEKADDVIESCNDITTASMIFEKIYAEKSAKIFKDLLENIGIKSDVEAKIENLADSVSEKVVNVVGEIISKIKTDIEVSTDVIVNAIENSDIHSNDSKDKKDKESNYIEEILNINASLKKASV